MEFDPNDNEVVMKFSMGTPPIDIHAIVDTGSDLVWTQCEPCHVCHKSKFGVFDPRKSSTHKNITCRSKDCRLLGDSYPRREVELCRKAPTTNCVYTYDYEDESYTVGHLGRETISLKSTTGNVVTLKDIIFGCGITNNITGSSENDMGLVGLGRGPLSFVSQVAPYVGGKKFSHCFVDNPNLESKIYFGNGSEVLGEGVVTVPLVDDPTAYYVTASGISIGNDFVPFNSNGTLLKKDNMMIDSGTPFPKVPQDLFNRMVTKLQKAVPLKSVIKKIKVIDALCFATTTPPTLPKMAIHFEGGGELPLSNKTLTFPVDDETYCLTIVSGTDDYSFFGGILQTNLLLGFDLDKNTVSFKPTDCIEYNKNN
ncbi:hypothetical protein ACLB2K_057471 [Fragaria x ananassa]